MPDLLAALVYVAGLWLTYKGLELLVRHVILNSHCHQCKQAMPAAHRYCGNCGHRRSN